MKKGTNRSTGGQRSSSGSRSYDEPVNDLREPTRQSKRPVGSTRSNQSHSNARQSRSHDSTIHRDVYREQSAGDPHRNEHKESQVNMFGDDLREEYEESIKKKKSSIPIVPILVGAIFIIVIVLVVCLYAYFANQEKQPTESNVSTETTTENTEATTGENPNAVYDENGKLISENGVYDLDGNVIDKDANSVGLPNFSDSEEGTTTEKYFSSSDFVKDLNGLDVPAVYNVKSRSYIKDFVNYDAKRAIMDDGMELYWLEVTYKNKKYRVQCPFYIFKDLDDSGICVVEIEVLNLEGGEKIISYMQVVQDYDELINN